MPVYDVYNDIQRRRSPLSLTQCASVVKAQSTKQPAELKGCSACRTKVTPTESSILQALHSDIPIIAE